MNLDKPEWTEMTRLWHRQWRHRVRKWRQLFPKDMSKAVINWLV